MRLTQNEIVAIIDAIQQNVSLQNAELRLFGSRANEDKKGGDIDLLLILPDKIVYKTVALKKVAIIVEIQRKIGEQKIDLVLAKREDLEKEPFLKLVFPSSCILHEW